MPDEWEAPQAQAIPATQEWEAPQAQVKASPPRKAKTELTPYDTRAAFTKLYPQFADYVTSQERPADSPLSKANPNSYHINSTNAIDVRPIPGIAFDDFVKSFKTAGHKVVESRDEQRHPMPWTTGPNWHIVLDGSEPPLESPQSPSQSQDAWEAPQALPASGSSPWEAPQAQNGQPSDGPADVHKTLDTVMTDRGDVVSTETSPDRVAVPNEDPRAKGNAAIKDAIWQFGHDPSLKKVPLKTAAQKILEIGHNNGVTTTDGDATVKWWIQNYRNGDKQPVIFTSPYNTIAPEEDAITVVGNKKELSDGSRGMTPEVTGENASGTDLATGIYTGAKQTVNDLDNAAARIGHNLGFHGDDEQLYQDALRAARGGENNDDLYYKPNALPRTVGEFVGENLPYVLIPGETAPIRTNMILGAMTSPDDPVTGALLGGTMGGLGHAGKLRPKEIRPSYIGEPSPDNLVDLTEKVINRVRNGPQAMDFSGQDWINTNTPKADLHAQVLKAINDNVPDSEIFKELGNKLPDTQANRMGLYSVMEDVMAGRDPTESLDNLSFRPDGLTVEETLKAVDSHTSDWTNPPEIMVHDSYDSDTIPDHLKDKVGPGILGFKDNDGSIHVIASQNADADAVTATMFHEGMHAGMVRAYQSGLESKLVDIFDNSPPNLRQALAEKWAELEDPQHPHPDWDKLSEIEKKALVTDEVLAQTAESGNFKQDFDKIAAYIRNFGRENLGPLGKKLKYSDAEIRTIMSTGHDAVAHGKDGGVGPTRYMFIGQRGMGDNGPPEDLRHAMDMADRGHDAGPDGKTRLATGWYKGPDGEWRREITDHRATFKADFDPQAAPAIAKLGDILEHPELFQHYPELLHESVGNDPGYGNTGKYRPGLGFDIAPDAPNYKATLMHEIQHWIQDKEGFAQGGNLNSAIKGMSDSKLVEVTGKVLTWTKEQLRLAETKKDLYDKFFSDPLALEYRKEHQKLQDSFALPRNEQEDPITRIARVKKVDSMRKALQEKYQGNLKGAREEFDKMASALTYYEHGGKVPRSVAEAPLTLKNIERTLSQSVDKAGNIVSRETLVRALQQNEHLPRQAYEHLFGEVEARDTANRRHLDEQGRWEKTPYTSEDHIEPNDYIIQRDNLRAAGEVSEAGETRFSRKYSGVFEKDYEGRQKRTEDILKNHFGNFSINNVKGMMRPLEQYNRLSQEDIFNAAQDLKDQGFNAEIAVAQGAIPDNAGFVVALRDLVRDKLEVASEVAGRYRKTGGMRHERELLKAVTELGQVLAVFDKTASNLGRMLYALRLRMDVAVGEDALQTILTNVRFANGHLDAKALDDIATSLISKDPIEIRKQIDRFDPKWKQYGTSLFYNFILGSKAVQLGNIMGNATHIVQKGLGDILGYSADKLGSMVGMTKNDRMHFDELMNRQVGMLSALLNAKTYNGYRALNTAGKELFVRAGQSEHQNKFASQSIESLPLSMVLEYGTRGLQAADAYFRTAVEHSAMMGLATREARRLNNGRKPTTEQIAEVMASPTREMLMKVRGEADRMTFQEDPFKKAEQFSRFMRGGPGFLIAPIIRTPSNIGRAAFETFDVTGRITKRNREALKKGGADATRVHGQQLLAAALWTGAIYLMNTGQLNGGGPAAPAARQQWLMSHVPYSIGNTKDGFLPLKGISPIGDGLAIIADGHEAWKYGNKDPDNTLGDTSLKVAAGMSDAYLSNSFMASVTDSLERGTKPTIQNLLGTLVQAGASVPIYSQVQKERDPYVRDTTNAGSLEKTMLEKSALMDNPIQHWTTGTGERDQLAIRRDVFGQPIIADSPTSKDPVAQEVGRLVDATGKSVVPGFNRTVKGVQVPNVLYNDFLEKAGPVLRDRVAKVMDKPLYQRATTDEQRAAVIASDRGLKQVHKILARQYEKMMSQSDPTFKSRSVPDNKRILKTIPKDGE